MIIGTVTVLLLLFGGGGGAFSFEKAFEPFIKDAVTDEVRYEQIIDLTKQADASLEEFQKEVHDVWSVELKKLVENYDSTPEDFRRFFVQAGQSRKAVQQEFLDIRFRAIGLMSEDEWSVMYGAMDRKAKGSD